MFTTKLKKSLISSLVVGSLFALGSTLNTAQAAQVSVSKLRVNLENGQTADFLTLQNESDTEKEAFEISLQKWTQQDNLNDKEKKYIPKEVLTDTENVLVSPKTVVIMPKQQKIVRIIVNNEDAAKADYSYRMIINQLPNHEVNSQKNTVNLLFKISLPIFVYKDDIKTADKMKFSHSVVQEGGHSYLVLKNEDSQHIQVKDVVVGDKSNSINHYLLSGTTDKIELPEGTGNKITLQTDKGELSFNK